MTKIGENNRTINGEAIPLDSRTLVDWLDYTVTKETALNSRNEGVLQAESVDSNTVEMVSTGIPHKRPKTKRRYYQIRR